MHRADALVVILVAPRPERHRAQAVGAHADPGSPEDSIFHRSTLRRLTATVKVAAPIAPCRGSAVGTSGDQGVAVGRTAGMDDSS